MIPARCNRRSCQARRNLPKRPEHYVRWPRCRYAGCGGRLYVDEYRLRRGARDHPPVCLSDCLPYPHRVGSLGCRRREDWEAERFARGPSRHCPQRPEEKCSF